MFRGLAERLGGPLLAALERPAGVDQACVRLAQPVLRCGRDLVVSVEVERLKDGPVEPLARLVRRGLVQLAGPAQQFQRGAQGGVAGFEVVDCSVELL